MLAERWSMKRSQTHFYDSSLPLVAAEPADAALQERHLGTLFLSGKYCREITL